MSDTGHELVALTLLLENKLGECRKQLADAKLQIQEVTDLREQLAEAREVIKSLHTIIHKSLMATNAAELWGVWSDSEQLRVLYEHANTLKKTL